MGSKEKLYQQIKNYFTDKPVKKVMLFGSFSRNEDNSTSDIDLIIQPDRPVGLITLGKYVADLEDITRRKVDLATENSLTPEFLALIKDDIKLVYAA